MKNKEKIGIIGVGMVGGALKNYFKKRGIKPLLYDKEKNIDSIKKVNEADIIFICVPTPYLKNKGFDLSAVEETCQKIKREKVLVIKSTVVPGTTKSLQKKYSQHKFLFNPEFLVEEKADEDMQNPERQIVGYTKKSKNIAEKILRLLPEAPFSKTIPSTEAEMVKYFGNSFLATKVIFANQIHSLCQALKINYETVRKCASADKRIGPSHLDINHGGYQGYGGKCLPKDIRALIQLANKNKVGLELHKKVEELNNKLMKKQNIKNPEKFSKRN